MMGNGRGGYSAVLSKLSECWAESMISNQGRCLHAMFRTLAGSKCDGHTCADVHPVALVPSGRRAVNASFIHMCLEFSNLMWHGSMTWS